MEFAVEIFFELKKIQSQTKKAWLLYRDVKAELGWKLFLLNLVSLKERAKGVGLC